MRRSSRSVSDPAELLAAARRLLARPDPNTAGLWPRGAALLARQALEHALDGFWLARAPGVEACSTRAQLLCLRYLSSSDLANRVAYAWAGLSRACHHHAYELPPTAGELEGWIEAVEEMVRRIELDADD